MPFKLKTPVFLENLNSVESSFESNNFFVRFFRLAILNILSNLMIPLSGFLSVAFLGHLGELYHLAGVTLAAILFNFLYRTLGFLRMSTTGITAQAVGRSEEDQVWLALLRNTLLALIIGLIIIVLQSPLRVVGFVILDATTDIKASGAAYYDTRIWGVPAALVNFVLIGWFLGREESGKVLLLSLLGNGCNILLDYLLIIRLHWDSMGAGLATALSQSLMCLVGLLFVIREFPWTRIQEIKSQLFVSSALIEYLSLNRDIFIRTFVFLSTFSLFTNYSSGMGIDILTENALLLQALSVTIYLIDGLAYATETLAGNFKGQDTPEQLLPLLQISFKTCFLIGLLCAGVFVVFQKPLFGLLTNHSEILEPLKNYVPWLFPVLGFGSIAFMLDGYFLGLAEGAILRNAALVATFIGFIPMAVVAWHLHRNDLLWLALSLFMCARVILLGVKVPQSLKARQ